MKTEQKWYTLTVIYRLLSGFKKGGGGASMRVCNIICRSLFYYYNDLFYYTAIYFPRYTSIYVLPPTMCFLLVNDSKTS
jgi:hypothetical protein